MYTPDNQSCEYGPELMPQPHRRHLDHVQNEPALAESSHPTELHGDDTVQSLYIEIARLKRAVNAGEAQLALSEIAKETLEIENNWKQEMLDRLHAETITDELTGAFNRRGFIQRFDWHQRRGDKIAVEGIDLVKFKRVNDEEGQTAGDEFIRIATQELAIRPGDSVARIGGDEILVILVVDRAEDSLTNLENARSVAARHKKEYEAHHRIVEFNDKPDGKHLPPTGLRNRVVLVESDWTAEQAIAAALPPKEDELQQISQ